MSDVGRSGGLDQQRGQFPGIYITITRPCSSPPLIHPGSEGFFLFLFLNFVFTLSVRQSFLYSTFKFGHNNSFQFAEGEGSFPHLSIFAHVGPSPQNTFLKVDSPVRAVSVHRFPTGPDPQYLPSNNSRHRTALKTRPGGAVPSEAPAKSQDPNSGAGRPGHRSGGAGPRSRAEPCPVTGLPSLGHRRG